MTREPLERLLEPAIDEARIASVWQRVRHTREHHTVSWLRWPLALAAAAAAVALAVMMWPAEHAGPLAVSSGQVELGAGAELGSATARTLDLDDGSRLELAAASRMQVLANEADQFAVVLAHGHVRFDVRPGGPRHWQIETSRATVEVVGTAFVVDSDAHRLAVEVERGVVVVRGERVAGRVVRLTAGQRTEVVDGEVKTAAADVPNPNPTPNPSPNPNPNPTSNPTPNPTLDLNPTPATTSTQPLTHHSSITNSTTNTAKQLATTHAARAHVAAAPTATAQAPSAVIRDPLADALAAADERRTSGDAAGAAAALERALANARADESAGLAQFTLGRIYLENLHQPDRAAAAFDHVLAIGMPFGLLEDARAKRIEALVQANQRVAAKAALVDYDRQHPHGVHRAMLHALLGPP